MNPESAAIVASSLNWEQAHAGLDHALKDLPAKLRGVRPDKFPHSVWELVEHIRRAQHDLLDFCANPKYEEKLKWPDDYWPSSPAPANDVEWKEALSAIHRDTAALAEFTTTHAATLEQKIPWGTGQTYLRTVLVAMDHTSYHVGQMVMVRRLLGAWG
jgi:uncharacterized damage-inducible protein DinB